MDFNELQKKIVDNIQGVYLVSAPVGTGKTTVLTERVVRALDSGVKPEEILCLTFTNRATEEMKSKLKERIDSKEILDNLVIKTFHGFCSYFVRAEAEEAGVASDFIIFDEEESSEVLEAILDKYPEFFNLSDRNNNSPRRILSKLYDHRMNELEKKIGCQVKEYRIDPTLIEIGEEYRQSLEEQNALDFNELVFLTVQILCTNEKIRKKWSQRFRFIQVDEFQDTHLSEYLVVKELAKTHRNVSFVGDLDQTIYTWRGSRPFFITNLVKHHFPEYKDFYLETNYRFNQNVLKAIKSFLKSFNNPVTKEISSFDSHRDQDKECIQVFQGYNFREEIDWVVSTIKDIRNREPGAKISVLSRTNYLIKEVADVFKQKNISHITVDKYEFFRKQEIKDVYAYLKIIFNKFDLESAYRVIKRPARNIGPVTIKKIREQGGAVSLRVSDFLNFKNYSSEEPFQNLIKNWDKGRLVVLDTETTGTNVLKDDLIQIYATEVVEGKVERDFHFFVKNTLSVGSSAQVHGLTDEFLQKNGRDPKEVLQELKDFIAGDPVVGHNVIFDLSILEENSKRQGLEFKFKDFYDTLDLSRRLLKSDSYKLTSLAESLGLARATHDAKDDVLATVDLLGILIEKMRENQKSRKDLFQKHSSKFIQLANLINVWQQEVKKKRPPEILEYIWEESGLKGFYEKDNKKEERFRSIQQLVDLFEKKDDPDRPPDFVLRELIHYASFNRGVDFLALEKGEVPVVTPHQVKGLEFDYVFVVGLNDYKFPIRNKSSDPEEEKRLFYVSLTRARNKIFLSYSQFDSYNRFLTKSPFLDLIDKEFIRFVGKNKNKGESEFEK